MALGGGAGASARCASVSTSAVEAGFVAAPPIWPARLVGLVAEIAAASAVTVAAVAVIEPDEVAATEAVAVPAKMAWPAKAVTAAHAMRARRTARCRKENCSNYGGRRSS